MTNHLKCLSSFRNNTPINFFLYYLILNFFRYYWRFKIIKNNDTITAHVKFGYGLKNG